MSYNSLKATNDLLFSTYVRNKCKTFYFWYDKNHKTKITRAKYFMDRMIINMDEYYYFNIFLLYNYYNNISTF